jgi:hypothetical protein
MTWLQPPFCFDIWEFKVWQRSWLFCLLTVTVDCLLTVTVDCFVCWLLLLIVCWLLLLIVLFVDCYCWLFCLLTVLFVDCYCWSATSIKKVKGLKSKMNLNKIITKSMIDWLIDWCLTPTLAVFQLYHGIQNL